MNLSLKAIKELREILSKDIGSKSVNRLSDKDLNEIGVLLITVTSIAIKRKQ